MFEARLPVEDRRVARELSTSRSLVQASAWGRNDHHHPRELKVPHECNSSSEYVIRSQLVNSSLVLASVATGTLPRQLIWIGHSFESCIPPSVNSSPDHITPTPLLAWVQILPFDSGENAPLW